MKIYYNKLVSLALSNFVVLAKCVGVTSEMIEVGSASALIAALENLTDPSDGGVVLDVSSLKDVCSQNELDGIVGLTSIGKKSVLLLTTECHVNDDRLLSVLTSGAVTKVRPGGGAPIVGFPRGTVNFARELTSQSYAREANEAIVLTLSLDNEAEVIMRTGDSPSFVGISLGGASIFVWSTLRIFDMLRPLTSEKEFEIAVEEYVPAIIFLRHAFPDQCWRNPMPRAGIVIDDPLLSHHYGFINFHELLESARSHGYHVTLAFIPWNYWRSSRKLVRWFIERADCFSICVHGCDHTRDEFRSDDYDDLLSRNFVARKRMTRHEQRTGMSWEPIMVCPQEQYSLEGMRAFSDSRQFLALVNTTCIPREGSSNRICGADLLLPAQDSYFGFPVFKRHYWNNMSVFAMALFLGKPAILVEHHEFFRKGPLGLEDFVSRLKELSPRIEWSSLYDTVLRTHSCRRSEAGNLEIRFFTDTFHLEHETDMAVDYRLIRRIPQATVVQRVTINGTDTPFTREGEDLNVRVRADHPELLKIQIEVNPVKPANKHSYGLIYGTTVAVRRGLSEIRDNVIVRNRFAHKAAKSVMRFLRQTGGGE